VLCVRLARIEPAALAFEQVLQEQPEHIDALVNLGSVRRRLCRFDEALALIGRALQLAPERADIHYKQGNTLAAVGRWHEAMDAFQRAVALAPDTPRYHYNEGIALHHTGQLMLAAAAYQRAVNLDGNYLQALTNLGVVQRELHKIEDAVRNFRAALALDPHNPTLQRNLRSAYRQQLPDWHWPMLADEDRNSAYQRAIARVVSSESVVLDIGTGSGLLAMMAARSGAQTVIACEISEPLAEVATEVVRDNGLQHQVRVINRKSMDLRREEDLPRGADVLVSEIVDVGLLGEGILPSIRHALQHLSSAQVRVIPGAATVYCQLVEAPQLYRVNPVRRISGFDLSAFDRFRIPGDYLDVRLERTPHRFLCEQIKVRHFDFTAPPPFTPEHAPIIVDLPLLASSSGTIHGMAFWFDLHLDDTTTISTAPAAGVEAWGQAVQFFDESLTVTKGDPVHVQALISDTRIEYRLGEE
jgi:Flp pilus assembly protein TadD